jgi:hypothetical protein
MSLASRFPFTPTLTLSGRIKLNWLYAANTTGPGPFMTKPYQRWIQFLYGPFFIVIGFFYRIYKSNRGRVETLITRDKVSFFIRNATLVILAIWFLVWYFAPEGSSDRLVEEAKQTIGGLKSLSE